MSDPLDIQFTDQQPAAPGQLDIPFVDQENVSTFGKAINTAASGYQKWMHLMKKYGWAIPGGQPTWLAAKLLSSDASPTRQGHGVVDAWRAGWQGSSTALILNERLPDIELDPQHAKWYEKLTSGAGQMAGDLPAMVAGGALAGLAGIETGPGAVVAAGAGAFAVPTAIRTSLIQAYSKGQVRNASDFLTRASIVVKETAKDAALGGLTSGTGLAAGKFAAPLGRTASRIIAGGSEVTVLTVAPAALEGRLPEPEDFSNAALLMAGMHGAHYVAGKLGTIYAKTGIPPLRVAADAKSNPTILADLTERATLGTEASHKSVQGNPPDTGTAEGVRGTAEEHPGTPARTGIPGSDPSLQAILRGLSRSEEAGLPHVEGAVLGTIEGETPSQKHSAGTGAISGQNLTVRTFDSGRDGAPHILVTTDTPGESGRPAYVVGSIHGNTFLTGALHVEGLKGVGYDLFQTLGEYLQENHSEVKQVVGLAGGTKENPEGIARVRNSFDGTQWEGKWAGTPVVSLAAGPAPRVAPEIPRAYQRLATQQAAMDAVPGLSQEVAKEFFGPAVRVSGEPEPTQVNYRYINTPDEVNGALKRMSDLNEAAIQKQRRGTVSWDQTQAEAGKLLSEMLGSPEDLFKSREAGTPAGAAEILARKQLVEGAANDMKAKAAALSALGADAPIEARRMAEAEFLASIERSNLITAEFLGARAEAGRALNILKETKVSADRADQVQKLLTQMGKTPAELAEMMAALEDPAAAMRLARGIEKATTWDMIIEAWKAGLVSGPVTQVANVMGNTSFMAMRPAVDAVAAGFSLFSNAPDRVRSVEPLARVYGDIHGTIDGLKLAKVAFFEDAPGGKAEHKQAIPGKLGYAIRTPFRALSAMDVMARTMTERGEAYALASRQAVQEGHNPATAEFRTRVAELVNNPDAATQKKITEAGARFTFNSPLGEKGRAIQQFIKAWHLQWAIPFISTPGNIFKEMARLTPAAPIVGEWREAVAKGGPEAAKAWAEVTLGTGLSAVAMSLAVAGHLSGSGDPDPNKRRIQMAAGWQPYSVKINGTWHSYQRFQPVGTLIGLAADMAEVWEHLTPDESDKVPKILATAFANSVTNQTFLQGMATLVDGISQPDQKGPRLVQNLAGSLVPAAISQTAQMMDPYQREISSIREAVQNRIPGARENLAPSRDPFGEPIASPDRMGWISPVTTKDQSTDKVRTEAARLGIGEGKAPKSISLPSGGTGLGTVDLNAQQRDVFGDVAGHLAYNVMSQMVHSPGWDYVPDLVKQKAYQIAFERSHQAGKAAALTDEERQVEIRRIINTVSEKLKPSKAVNSTP